MLTKEEIETMIRALSFFEGKSEDPDKAGWMTPKERSLLVKLRKMSQES